MDILSIIEKKKAAKSLTKKEIEFVVKGAVDGSIPDYQLAALLMAIRLQGMTPAETVQLTVAMTHSGSCCSLEAIPGIKVDKHSSGGVGDTTTLIVAPLVAACGVFVAKMSGRGLGHTGGTLDKLESIPGMNVSMDESTFIKQVQDIGIAVIGQTEDLAPADKRLYALRDVTSTVDSQPLIVSSILSKKLASGADAIVLDVKCGSGAFMHSPEDALALAKKMVEIGNRAGKNTVALITDMNQPLGRYVGNALEVKEAIDILSGRTRGDLLEVSLELAAQMLICAEKAANRDEAMAKLHDALDSGKGLEKLRQMIKAQGGNEKICDDTSYLPKAPVEMDVLSPEDGYVSSMNTLALGVVAQSMGAGRKTKEDIINPSVGFFMSKRLGDPVRKGECLVKLYASTKRSAEAAARGCLKAIMLSAEKPEPVKLIYALVKKDEKSLFL